MICKHNFPFLNKNCYYIVHSQSLYLVNVLLAELLIQSGLKSSKKDGSKDLERETRTGMCSSELLMRTVDGNVIFGPPGENLRTCHKNFFLCFSIGIKLLISGQVCWPLEAKLVLLILIFLNFGDDNVSNKFVLFF